MLQIYMQGVLLYVKHAAQCILCKDIWLVQVCCGSALHDDCTGQVGASLRN